ncbi:hypothetical protein [Hymenobacter sp. B81]|uniref:hypothetical protein n=1 Tax=Hymenobacter sp. B81 TaxID=3344878 RepID=UPI0037DD9BCC
MRLSPKLAALFLTLLFWCSSCGDAAEAPVPKPELNGPLLGRWSAYELYVQSYRSTGEKYRDETLPIEYPYNHELLFDSTHIESFLYLEDSIYESSRTPYQRLGNSIRFSRPENDWALVEVSSTHLRYRVQTWRASGAYNWEERRFKRM